MNTPSSNKDQNYLMDFTIRLTALINRELEENGGEIKLKDLLAEFYDK